jgi:hypothetical protein
LTRCVCAIGHNPQPPTWRISECWNHVAPVD